MAPPLPILTKEATTTKPKGRNQAQKKKVSFKRRYSTLKKKAEELGKLCDTPVCYVCFGSDGKVYTSPEDKTSMKDTFMKFKENTSCKENKDLLGFLEDSKKKLEEKNNIPGVKEVENLFASWNERIQESCDKTLMNFNDYLENKLQVLIERSRFLEEAEKGKAIQVYNDGESGPSSLNSPCSCDLCKTNNLNIDQQFCNPSLSLAANYVTNSTWPLDYYTDVGSSSSSGSNCLLENLDPKNSDLMGYSENSNNLPLGFAQANTGFTTDFGIPKNFDLMGYNNNSTPVVEIKSDILPNNDFPLEFAQTNMGFNTQNIDMMGDDSNSPPFNDIPLEFADITTGFRGMENSSLMGESTNDFLLDDDDGTKKNCLQ